MINLNHRKIRLDLLRVHCEDAAFLFSLRLKALEAPNYRLIDIFDLEERMRGHLQAVLLADDAGASMAADVLGENTGAGELFVAAYVVAHRTGPRGLAALIDDWDASLEHTEAFAGALAWCPPDVLSAFMTPWISSADPRLVRVALDVCTQHRVNPRHHLDLALTLGDSKARSAAFRCAGVCGRDDLKGSIAEHAATDAEAAFAGTLFGDVTRSSGYLLKAIKADPAGAFARRAAELAPLGMERDAAREDIRALLSTPETARWGIVATGALGLPETLGWLVKQMEVAELARVAAAAFATITGANMKDPDLEMTEFPEDPDNPITEANLAEDFYESNLPWVEPQAAADWLAANETRFAPGERHIFGLAAWSYDASQMVDLTYQSEFRALSYELAMRKPGAVLVNWGSQVRLENGVFVRDW